MLCCCWEKTVEKKAITKPLLAESKSTGEPKVIERKLTGFEPAPLPSSKPEPVPVPKPIVVEPETIVMIEPEPAIMIVPEPVKPLPPKPVGPKPVIQAADPQEQEQEEAPATFVEKNNFVPRDKRRSKSRR